MERIIAENVKFEWNMDYYISTTLEVRLCSVILVKSIRVFVCSIHNF